MVTRVSLELWISVCCSTWWEELLMPEMVNLLQTGRWYHVACNLGYFRKPKIFLMVNVTVFQTQRVEIILETLASPNIKSTSQQSFDGTISWSRVSNTVRYSTAFWDPSRWFPPTTDANPSRWNMTEGTGTSQVANSGSDVEAL